MVYVEVKMKNNKDRMVKFRQPVTEHRLTLEGFDRSWLPPHFPYDFDGRTCGRVEPLSPVHACTTLKTRNALQSTWISSSAAAPNRCEYQGLCVVEVKQAKFSMMRSPLGRQLHRLHLQPRSVSKFCVAATHFYPGFKSNSFKPLLLYLSRHFPLRGAL